MFLSWPSVLDLQENKVLFDHNRSSVQSMKRFHWNHRLCLALYLKAYSRNLSWNYCCWKCIKTTTLPCWNRCWALNINFKGDTWLKFGMHQNAKSVVTLSNRLHPAFHWTWKSSEQPSIMKYFNLFKKKAIQIPNHAIFMEWIPNIFI